MASSIQSQFPTSEETKCVVKRIPVERITNPLLLSPVIERIYKFLPLKELLKFRLVSREWNYSSISLLRSRAEICLDEFNKEEYLQMNRPDEVHSEHLELPAYRIYSSGSDNSWTLTELDLLFKRHGKRINELLFDFGCGHFDSPEGELIPTVCGYLDIFSWIFSRVNSPITVPNTKYNTRFIFDGRDEDEDECECGRLESIIISLDVLVHVKQLELNMCNVYIQDRMISPIVLELFYVSIFQNGIFLSNVIVNNFIDFSRAKLISLESSEYEYTNLILDLSRGALNLDKLSLLGVVVLNWQMTTWTTNILFLCAVNLIEKTEMKIKELHFCEKEIDLSVVPQSVEKLSISRIGNATYGTRVSCSEPIALLNLKYLKLYFARNENSSILSHFVGCPNLVMLTVSGTEGNIGTIKLDWIPKSVKSIRLKSVLFPIGEHGCFTLKKLILDGYSQHDIKEICSHFKVDELQVINSLRDSSFWDECMYHFCRNRIVSAVVKVFNNVQRIVFG